MRLPRPTPPPAGLRRAPRVLRALALNPVAVGAAWLLGAYGLVAMQPVVARDEPLLGRSAAEVANRISVHYAGDIRHVTMQLAVIALLYGMVLGGVAAALLALRGALRNERARLTGLRAAGVGLAVVVALHTASATWAMASHPQFYAPVFWHHGGVLARVQLFVTDTLHPVGVEVLSVLALVLWLLGRPSRWVGAARAVVRAARLRRGFLIGGTAFATAAVLVAAAPRPTASLGTGARGPNVVILASDSLRADRLDATTMPRLDALAARGTRFERAYTSVPRTFGSWMTLLTGRYPHGHGVRSDLPRWELVKAPFDAFPRRLSSQGYATAVVSDYAGDIFSRIDVGFDATLSPHTGLVSMLRQRAILRALPLLPALQSHMGRRLLPDLDGISSAADPELLADDAIRSMRRMEAQPFLLVVFFSTTHFPYAAPAPYFARFADPSYRGTFLYEKTVSLGTAQEPPPNDVRQTRALYDGAAFAVDAAAGRVLDAIDRDGLSERTIVVVTADHGENLFENGRGQGHGDHLFGDEATHVPLVIYDPRVAAPHAERAIVQTVDLAPTICDLVGAPPPAGADGRSLASAVRGEGLAPGLAYAETELWLLDDMSVLRGLRVPTPGVLDLLEVDTEHGDQIVTNAANEPISLFARHRMVRDDRWKLLYAPTVEGAHYELYDTLDDPEELVDVSARAPETVARLKESLWRWMLADPAMRREGGYLVPRGHELEQFLPRVPR